MPAYQLSPSHQPRIWPYSRSPSAPIVWFVGVATTPTLLHVHTQPIQCHPACAHRVHRRCTSHANMAHNYTGAVRSDSIDDYITPGRCRFDPAVAPSGVCMRALGVGVGADMGAGTRTGTVCETAQLHHWCQWAPPMDSNGVHRRCTFGDYGSVVQARIAFTTGVTNDPPPLSRSNTRSAGQDPGALPPPDGLSRRTPWTSQTTPMVSYSSTQ
jgi:hypothetical protein